MAKKYDTTINGKKIVVTIEDDDEQYFPVSFEDYTGPDPDATPAPPSFYLLEEIVDIKISNNKPDKKEDAKRVKVKKITIEIEYDQATINKAEQKGKTEDDLDLGYYLDNEWHPFLIEDEQSKEKFKVKIKLDKKKDKEKGKGTIEFKEWVFDPPVGWGFL